MLGEIAAFPLLHEYGRLQREMRYGIRFAHFCFVYSGHHEILL